MLIEIWQVFYHPSKKGFEIVCLKMTMISWHSLLTGVFYPPPPPPLRLHFILATLRKQIVFGGWNFDCLPSYSALWRVSENRFERPVFWATRIDSEKQSGRKDWSQRAKGLKPKTPCAPSNSRRWNAKWVRNNSFVINHECRRRTAQFNE